MEKILQVKLEGLGRYMGWDFGRKKTLLISKLGTILIEDGILKGNIKTTIAKN